MRTSTWTRLAGSLALVALIATPAVATDVITSGADQWSTAQTYTTFEQDPLPADFFCPGSATFDGKIDLEGVPLATEPECILGAVDTVVHRLDDATFDADGTASTRLRFLAISLAGKNPLEIEGCGSYDVTASLAKGEQPVTEMTIRRTADNSGTFLAPLKLNVNMVFTPRDGGEPRSVRRHIYLGPGTSSVWSVVPMPEKFVRVRVDTDGDRVADTFMPAPTNFAAGNIDPNFVIDPLRNIVPAQVVQPYCWPTNPPPVQCPDPDMCPYQSCHCTPPSQTTNPFEPDDNCRRNDDGTIEVCHLHCVNNCIPCEQVPPHERPTEF